MAINSYWNNFNQHRTQRYVEDLIIEATKIYGLEVWYIPQTVTNLDDLFGENPAASFDKATKFEVFIKNPEGFGGQQLMSKFGLEVQQTMSFYLPKRRFTQSMTNKLSMENGWTYQLEDADLTAAGNTESLVLDEAPVDNPFQITTNKPLAGDLLWFPLGGRLMKINFTDDDEIFWPMGTNPVFTLDCELFDYSSEKIDTGVSVVDSIGDLFKNDALTTTFLLESGDHMLDEEGSVIILEEYDSEATDVNNNKSIFDDLASDVVDWSDKSPLVNRDASGRW